MLGLDINTTNNLREMPAVGYMGLVGVGKGKFEATGTLTVYFEDAVMYNKLIASTATSIACIFNKNNQAYVFSLPRVKLAGGTPSAAGQNQDVPLEMSFTALKDTVLTQKTMLIDRLEYYE